MALWLTLVDQSELVAEPCNEATYHVPAPEGARTALYIDPEARVPPFRGVEYVVRSAMPLVVVRGLGEGDEVGRCKLDPGLKAPGFDTST